MQASVLAVRNEGNAAIRLGPFKLVRQYSQDWELYDMEADRTELHNLAGASPKLEAGLKGQYLSWATQTGILDWEVALPKLLDAWKLSSAEG